jgi:hypothetical protein
MRSKFKGSRPLHVHRHFRVYLRRGTGSAKYLVCFLRALCAVCGYAFFESAPTPPVG